MTHPYATRQYARTLAHVGEPLYVEPWGTHVIVREWRPGIRDASGTYPVACLDPGSDVRAGIEMLREAGLVSVVLVVDGLYGPAMEHLREAFRVIRPWKTHYVADPAVGPYAPSSHHAYEIRRATRHGLLTRVLPLHEVLDEWCALYEQLSHRHSISGAPGFPRDAFERLAESDGFVTVAALRGDELESCHIYAVDDGYAISHLAATSRWGYSHGAAYLASDAALRELAGCVVNLGGSAGMAADGMDGLARFKAGFANRRQRSCLLGEVLDADKYPALCHGLPRTDFFPAYRAPAK